MNVVKTQYLRAINLEASIQVIDSVSGGVNGGCDLYITCKKDATIRVKNISGDEVSFFNLISGTILPFSVTEIIYINNVDKLVALW